MVAGPLVAIPCCCWHTRGWRDCTCHIIIVIHIPVPPSSSSSSLTLDCVANIVDKWLQVGVVAGECAVVREVDKWWEAGLREGMESSGKEKSRLLPWEDNRASHIVQRRERCVVHLV